jgi:hypothetical protein
LFARFGSDATNSEIVELILRPGSCWQAAVPSDQEHCHQTFAFTAMREQPHDYLADPRMKLLKFIQLKKYLEQNGASKKDLFASLTKFALVETAEKLGIPLAPLLDEVGSDPKAAKSTLKTLAASSDNSSKAKEGKEEQRSGQTKEEKKLGKKKIKDGKKTKKKKAKSADSEPEGAAEEVADDNDDDDDTQVDAAGVLHQIDDQSILGDGVGAATAGATMTAPGTVSTPMLAPVTAVAVASTSEAQPAHVSVTLTLTADDGPDEEAAVSVAVALRRATTGKLTATPAAATCAAGPAMAHTAAPVAAPATGAELEAATVPMPAAAAAAAATASPEPEPKVTMSALSPIQGVSKPMQQQLAREAVAARSALGAAPSIRAAIRWTLSHDGAKNVLRVQIDLCSH